MNSWNVRNSGINVFSSEGTVTMYFVFGDNGVISIPYPLLQSPTGSICRMVNSGLQFYPSQINISENTTVFLSVNALVTLTEFSVWNESHLGCKQNIYVYFLYFLFLYFLCSLREHPFQYHELACWVTW